MTDVTSSAGDDLGIRACTISRDVQIFDLLIEDMETLLGESWGDLGFGEAVTFLRQPEAANLEFVALAIDDTDEDQLDMITAVVESAKSNNIKVMLIAEDVSPSALHGLLKAGADEFVPYPLPEGELAAAVERLNKPEPVVMAPAAQASPVKLKADGDGVLIAVQGFAGGTGATTFAVNLAWELANVDKDNPPRVCMIDLGLQFGSISTYLDLPRKEIVVELLADIDTVEIGRAHV